MLERPVAFFQQPDTKSKHKAHPSRDIIYIVWELPFIILKYDMRVHRFHTSTFFPPIDEEGNSIFFVFHNARLVIKYKIDSQHELYSGRHIF